MKKSVLLLTFLVLAVAIVAFTVAPAFGAGEGCDIEENADGYSCDFIGNGSTGGVYECSNGEGDSYLGWGAFCFEED